MDQREELLGLCAACSELLCSRQVIKCSWTIHVDAEVRQLVLTSEAGVWCIVLKRDALEELVSLFIVASLHQLLQSSRKQLQGNIRCDLPANRSCIHEEFCGFDVFAHSLSVDRLLVDLLEDSSDLLILFLTGRR